LNNFSFSLDRKFILLLALCGYANAIYFDCDYSTPYWYVVGNVYTCKARVLPIGGNDLLGVMGNHMNGYSNNRVEGLRIDNQQISSLPTGIAKIFPNLKTLSVYNSQLKTINKEDLKPFPNLRLINFNSNQLEVLDGDLFVGTPNLEFIDFGHNKIKNVGSGLLGPLTKLTTAYFHINICINQYVTSTSAIVTLKQNLATQCPPTTDMLADELNKNGRFKNIIQKMIDDRTNPLKAVIVPLTSKLDINVQATKALERRTSELEFQLAQLNGLLKK